MGMLEVRSLIFGWKKLIGSSSKADTWNFSTKSKVLTPTMEKREFYITDSLSLGF